MRISWVEYIPVVILMVTSLELIILQRWRWTMIALAVQYLAVFWMVAYSWPAGLAAIKLVSGWMAGAILVTTQPLQEQIRITNEDVPGRIFRMLAVSLVWIVVFATGPALAAWTSIPLPFVEGGMVLFLSGLLQLGMSQKPLRVTLGLLTVLSGFEISYSVVESSILVAGLMAGVTLGLAMVGAYLLSSHELEDEA